MADADDGKETQDDLLKWMQMEALGVKRREKITTADFQENRNYTSISQLEDMRKALGGDYKPAKQGQSKIVGWNNIYLAIENDGTLAAGDLRSVNEGLGQTHRAKLMDNDTVREYTGEPGCFKFRSHHGGTGYKDKKGKELAGQKTHCKKKATARVTRARVLGGNTSTTTTLSGDARAHLPSVPTSMFKSVTVTASEAKAREAKRFAQATESYKRQERSIHSPLFNDSRAFMASVQGTKVQASQQTPVTPADKTSTSNATDETLAPTTVKILASQTSASKVASRALKRPAPTIESSDSSSLVAEKGISTSHTLTHFNRNKDEPGHPNMITADKFLQPGNDRQSPPQSRSQAASDAGLFVSLEQLESIGITLNREQLCSLAAFASPALTNSDSNDSSRLDRLPCQDTPISCSKTSTQALSSAAVPRPTSVIMSTALDKGTRILGMDSGPLVTATSSQSDMTPMAKTSGSVAGGLSNDASPAGTYGSIATGSFDTKPESTRASVPNNDITASVRHGNSLVQTDTAATMEKSALPIRFTIPKSSLSTNSTSILSPVASNADLTSTVSPSEVLRRQREMIIGPQVYKNRYSLAAGSLVDNFRRLSLTNSTPVLPKATQAQSSAATALAVQNTSAATPEVATQSVGVTTLAPLAMNSSKATRSLRPQFIPDLPVPVASVLPSTALTPRTTNPPRIVTNPFGPVRRGPAARSTCHSGPSLPSHLMSNVTTSDHGVAARAQYGSN